MRIKVFLLTFILLISLLFAVSCTYEGTSTPITHIVQEGESLWSISMYFFGTGNRVFDILYANGMAIDEMLFVGQIIIIPKP
ncbi:MAG: LysM peptidoglycan-binding domain-containing protein [Defluviitaleaceae bacterium]|nr:LysM peptidoglycan-binding domain-containing protein [Defluviitaleaceae bacterium]